MAIEVFNRYEKKYMLNEYQYKMLTEELKKHMQWDAYNQGGKFYKIVNIYFDTSSDELIETRLRDLYIKKSCVLEVMETQNCPARCF